MIVTDPDGVATSTDFAQFSRAIAHFERWTGWRTVCVPELQVRPELREGAIIGLYQGPHQPIQLASLSGHDTAVHEMCHAADDRLGWLSHEHPELFPVTHIDSVTYSTRRAQIRESFARTCEQGPEGMALMRAVEQICGVPLEHPGHQLVVDLVYEQAQPVSRAADVNALGVSDLGVEHLIGDGRLLDVASGGRLLWLVVRDPTPLREAGNPTDRLVREQWRLVGLRPDTGMVEQEHVLLRNPVNTLERARTLRVLDSADDPIFVEGTAVPPTHVWMADEQTGELVRLPDLPVALGVGMTELEVSGVVEGEVALMRVVEPPVELLPQSAQVVDAVTDVPNRLAGAGWVAFETQTGEIVDDHAVYTGIFDDGLPGPGLTLTATEEGLVAVGLETGVVPFWPYRAMRLGPDGRVESLNLSSAAVSSPLGVFPDGTLLGMWSDLEVWHTIDQRRFFVASGDDPSQWWAPDDLCAPREVGFGVQRVMHVDGRMLLFGASLNDSRRLFRELTLE